MVVLCLPVRVLARRASDGSGLERTDTRPVELEGSGWDVWEWSGVAEDAVLGSVCLRWLMVGCRRWMIGVRIVWNISRVCERKGSRDCSMICVCVYHWSGG